jgi:hypothetical protein
MSTILTGAWKDKHGVVDNSINGSRYDQYFCFSRRIKEHKSTAFLAGIINWTPINTYIVTHANLEERSVFIYAGSQESNKGELTEPVDDDEVNLYDYVLTQAEMYTLFTLTGVDSRTMNTPPRKHNLWHNYPNPFKQTTVIRHQLAQNDAVNL